jgi:hypothetical protein
MQSLSELVLQRLIGSQWHVSPYYNVRNLVAYLFQMICQSVSHPAQDTHGDSTVLSPALTVFIAHCRGELANNCFVHVQVDGKEQPDDPNKRMKTDEKDDSARMEQDQTFIASMCTWGMYWDAAWLELGEALLSAHHSEGSKEVSDLIATANRSKSFSAFSAVDLPRVVAKTRLASNATQWHVRKAAALFLSVFIPRNAFLLTSTDLRAVYKLLARLVGDGQLEVRDAAFTGLGNLFAGTAFLQDEPTRRKTIKRFMKAADTRFAGLRDTELRAALDKRHAGALGLAAIVNSHPYTCPEYLCPVLGFLARKSTDPHPVGSMVVKVFANFKVSHKDEWEKQKLLFSEEDLDAVNAVGFTASYFA